METNPISKTKNKVNEKRVNIEFSQDLHRHAKAIAALKGVNLANFIQDAIEQTASLDFQKNLEQLTTIKQLNVSLKETNLALLKSKIPSIKINIGISNDLHIKVKAISAIRNIKMNQYFEDAIKKLVEKEKKVLKKYEL